jgi:hypothetical protein
MANTKIANIAAIDACDAVVDLLDLGASNAFICIYANTQPVGGPDAAAGEEPLANLTCYDPAFGNAADAAPGGQATSAGILDDTSADATGTATWFRAYTSNSVAIIDGDVNTAGADLNLNTTSIQSGATVSITSWTITMPES